VAIVPAADALIQSYIVLVSHGQTTTTKKNGKKQSGHARLTLFRHKNLQNIQGK